MEESFKTEIISPEKIIFSDNNNMTTIPSYEGDMSILKNHIPVITFLKPGIIKVNKDKENTEEFFVKDGTVEFFNNTPENGSALFKSRTIGTDNTTLDRTIPADGVLFEDGMSVKYTIATIDMMTFFHG